MLVHPSSGACDLLWTYFMCCIALVRCVLVLRCGSTPTHQQTSNQSNTTHEITQQISRKLLRMDVLTCETCWTLNNEIIKRVTSRGRIHLWRYLQLFRNIFPFISKIFPKVLFTIHSDCLPADLALLGRPTLCCPLKCTEVGRLCHDYCFFMLDFRKFFLNSGA